MLLWDALTPGVPGTVKYTGDILLAHPVPEQYGADALDFLNTY